MCRARRLSPAGAKAVRIGASGLLAAAALLWLAPPAWSQEGELGQAFAPPQTENDRRADIRRMLEPEGKAYLPTGSRERRVMSREELLRLREDLRANRDIYEMRERSARERR